MPKLWSSRFDSDSDSLTDELNASIFFDRRLYREDIEGSIVHAEMLAKQGIISETDRLDIQRGLRNIQRDIEAGAFEFRLSDEDIHMAVESELTRRIGDAGKRLHTARSRNDQVALDFRLYVKRSIGGIRDLVLKLVTVLADSAEMNIGAIMPAYTHLQRAQPTTMGHYLAAYAYMFVRDITRLNDCSNRLDYCPLGSGALTTTTYPIDREWTAARLGFTAPTPNSLDGVSDRDYAIELLACLSLLASHMSRLAEEIILWCSWEFRFVELDDRFTTGSSIMPQKKNPDIAELVRGKTGRVYGDLMSLLTVMKGLPLAYNKDMQEDKEPVFDAIDTMMLCIPAFTAMIETMRVNAENSRKAAAEGFINATDCADWLVRHGLPFRDAYTVVGKLVKFCGISHKTLETLTIQEYRNICDIFDESVYDAIDLDRCVERRSIMGGPAPAEVRRQIEDIRRFAAGERNNL